MAPTCKLLSAPPGLLGRPRRRRKQWGLPGEAVAGRALPYQLPAVCRSPQLRCQATFAAVCVAQKHQMLQTLGEQRLRAWGGRSGQLGWDPLLSPTGQETATLPNLWCPHTGAAALLLFTHIPRSLRLPGTLNSSPFPFPAPSPSRESFRYNFNPNSNPLLPPPRPHLPRTCAEGAA